MKNPYLYYCIARWFYLKRVPYIPTVITFMIRLVFSCWLPHSAVVGRGCVLGYGGLGVVISRKAVLGNRVHVGAGVTVGGNARERGAARIGNDVYLGNGAKILGPISLGDGCIIGANAVVTSSVPSGAVVVGVPGRIIREDVDINEFLYHLREE